MEDKNKISALESECRLLRTEKDALESQITQQLTTIRSLENDMREVRQSLATAEKDHMNEMQALEAEITSLKAQLASSANTGVDQVRKCRTMFSNRCRKLEMRCRWSWRH